MQCRHCGRQIPDESTFCPSCRASIALNPSDQEPQWVSYKDTHVFLRKIDKCKYHIAVKIEVEARHIGEVQSDDMGRSWKFRAINERGYILEGTCDDLDDGIRSIMRTLWGYGLN